MKYVPGVIGSYKGNYFLVLTKLDNDSNFDMIWNDDVDYVYDVSTHLPSHNDILITDIFCDDFEDKK